MDAIGAKTLALYQPQRKRGLETSRGRVRLGQCTTSHITVGTQGLLHEPVGVNINVFSSMFIHPSTGARQFDHVEQSEIGKSCNI